MADSKKIIPFILKWEGGLSNDKSDSASQHPAPCTYKGVSGYHTNKGITYQTFSSLADKLSYDDSCDTFFQMPVEVFNKIYRNGYWNPYLLDDYKYQAIADVIVSWAWASGLAGAYKQLYKFYHDQTGKDLPSKKYASAGVQELKDYFNSIPADKSGEVYKKLVLAYQDFYKRLNQPKYIKGWLNRLADLVTFSTGSVAEVVKKNPKKIIFGLVVVSAVGVYAYKRMK